MKRQRWSPKWILAQSIYQGMNNKSKYTQAKFFELIRLIAGKQNEAAAALALEMMEENADMIELTSILVNLKLEEAKTLLEQIQPALKAGKQQGKTDK